MSSATRWFVVRSARYLVTLWVVLTMIFLLFRLMPGSPLAVLFRENYNEESRQAMIELYGLNRPLHEQYLIYVRNLLSGEFGISFFNQRPVGEIIFPRLLNTFTLVIPALLVALAVGYYLGGRLGWKRGEREEIIGSYLTVSLRSIPDFVLGIVLLIVFSYGLNLLPLGGMQSFTSPQQSVVQLVFDPEFYRYWFLPFVAIALYISTEPILLMRGNVIDEQNRDYIRLHRLKGENESTVRNHAIRNSQLPLLTYSSTLVNVAFGTAILIEVVFSWPGIGSTLVTASERKDFPIAQAAFFLIALIVVTGNYVIDLLYAYFDPQIQYGGSK